MFWLRANTIDSDIKSKVIERSGGFCECTLPRHHHASGKCGNHLSHNHYYFSRHRSTDNRLVDVIVICPTCYRAIMASRIA